MALHRTGGLSLVAVVSLIASASHSKPDVKMPPVQPRAPIRIEQTNLGEIELVDPYRWMEEPNSPEFATWVNQQDDYARAVLETNTEREQITKRIAELANSQDDVEKVRRRGGDLFYLRRPAKGDTYRLIARGKDGADRLLLDPAAASDGHNGSIDYYEPSPDGRYVALGISSNGSDEPLLRVLEVRTGELLAERIARTHNGFPHWRPDGNAFFYMRRPPLAAGAPLSTRNQKARSYLHVVGTDAAHDPAVFGYELSPNIPVGIGDSTFVRPYSGSPFALAAQVFGAKSQRILYYAPVRAVVDSNTPWKKLSDPDDGIEDYVIRGHDLYLLTHRDAPRGKVLRVDLHNPDLAHAEVVVPPRTAVAVELAIASDALYVQLLDGGVGQILRVPFDGAAAARLKLPFDGAVSELDADPSQPGITFQLSSWVRPRVAYGYDPASSRCSELGLTPIRNQGMALESKEVMVPSADGTAVPLSIVYRRGLDLSVPHPTILQAYGGYGVTFDPYFESREHVWFEHDGVYATAHVRGGGEYGEAWHVAGMKQHKQNTFDDFVACARYLIKRKVTSAALLAAEGRSAGAITISNAVVQHPELFAAASIDVGIFDPLRFEKGAASGAVIAREFGSADNPAELPSLYAMSAYYHIDDGTRYPAMLLTGAAHDPRVPLWQPAKMAARLQAATKSGKPVLLRINYEGGHWSTTEAQRASEAGDRYAFLLWQMRRSRAPRR